MLKAIIALCVTIILVAMMGERLIAMVFGAALKLLPFIAVALITYYVLDQLGLAR